MFGVRILPLVVATIAFYLVGAVWYGVVFSQTWVTASGYTSADFEGSNPAWMGLGIVIAFFTVLIIAKVLNWLDVQSVGEAVSRTLVLWIGFGATAAAYTLTYSPDRSIVLYFIDGGHLLVAWVVAAIVLTVMK